MNKSRLEAFSDGVFAIVITLLILDIRIPDVKYEDLGGALIAIYPRVIAYVMSFLVIGLYWIFHHNNSQLLHKVDRPFVWMNVVFLLCVSFMPFPTILMGKYPFKLIPVLIYGANLLAANIMGFIMILYLYRNKELCSERFTEKVFRIQIRTYGIINGLYIIALGVAFYNPTISYVLFVAILFYLILSTKSNRHSI